MLKVSALVKDYATPEGAFRAVKDVSFDVTAKRTGGDLTATATANPTWKFGDFGMSPPSSPLRVVSVVDEIKLVVDLVATLRS